MTKMTVVPESYNSIRAEIVELLNAARSTAAHSVNALMTATYWEIGRRIVQSEQAGEKRAEYGEELIQRLAKDLSPSLGRGLWRTQPRPDEELLSRLAAGQDFADTVCKISNH
jgi:DUF1016 N-terminal domain